MADEIPETIISTLEKNLQQNEEQYRRLIDALPDVLYSYSLAQGGIFYSPAVFKILGHTPEYLLEHPFLWKNSIHPDDLACTETTVRDFLLGKPYELAYRIRHAAGHWVWLRDRSISCYELHGDYIIQGIASDITEIKRSDQNLHQAKELAEEANRLKNQFLATVSHEIRTPLNCITCMTQLLRFSSLTADQQAAVDAIDLSGENLLELLNDIIKLAKIETGMLQLDRYEFSLHKLIHDVIASQTPRIHEKQLSLRTEIPDGGPDRLAGDLLRIKLILQNLLANAIAASDRSDISITVTMLQHENRTASLQLSVRDAGTHIPQAALESIFLPFDGLNRTRGKPGLGLSICRSLAELMGGHIWAENSEGGGNTFHLMIPVEICNTKPDTSFDGKTDN